MSKGPSTCKKYREEFQEAERNDDAFKCKRCDQHPDWHEREQKAPAIQGNYYLHPVISIESCPSHIFCVCVLFACDTFSLMNLFY